MGATHFVMRRQHKVATEIALNVLAYNMKRVITILGCRNLLSRRRSVQNFLAAHDVADSVDACSLSLGSVQIAPIEVDRADPFTAAVVSTSTTPNMAAGNGIRTPKSGAQTCASSKYDHNRAADLPWR
jgi:transposase